MGRWLTKRATPIGDVLAVRGRRGLIWMGFADGGREPPSADRDRNPVVAIAIDRYFAGDTCALDALDVAPEGTALQRRTWASLRHIPPGATRSYAELGERVGSSARVVGNAMAANPICLALPCHRVIRSDGTWQGYAFGDDRKRWLLAHEAK